MAGLFHCGIFLLACALSCAAIRRGQPFQAGYGILQKYRYFAAHRDEYDVLFLGSSRFYHQIIPRQFDAGVEKAAGVKIRSFNFGYDGSWPPESYFVLRKLLALHPRKLRWVVVDLMDINPNLDSTNSTLRTAYWHDFQHTLMAWRRIAEQSADRPPVKTRELYLAHAEHLFKQWTSFGRGAGFWDERMASAAKKKKTNPAEPPKDWAGAEGYNSEPDQPMVGDELRHFEESVQRLRRGLASKTLSPAFSKAVRELSADIRAAGARPLFVIAPTLNPNENFAAVPDGSPLFGFSDPHLYPALYDAAMHYDGWHLNEKGAVIFTELLVERFCAQLPK